MQYQITHTHTLIDSYMFVIHNKQSAENMINRINQSTKKRKKDRYSGAEMLFFNADIHFIRNGLQRKNVRESEWKIIANV